MYSSSDATLEVKSTAVEFETKATREEIAAVFVNDKIDLHFDGGFYTVIATHLSADEVMKKLVNSQISISYCRDITNSTKRFFN